MFEIIKFFYDEYDVQYFTLVGRVIRLNRQNEVNKIRMTSFDPEKKPFSILKVIGKLAVAWVLHCIYNLTCDQTLFFRRNAKVYM